MNDFRNEARANVERNLADAITEDMLEDGDVPAALFYEEVFVLALDGALAAGATEEEAAWAASSIQTEY